MPVDDSSSSDERSTPRFLSYSALPIEQPAPIDFAALAIISIQIGLAILLCVTSFAEHGYHELAPAPWYMNLAWWWSFEEWRPVSAVWAILSLCAAYGAIRPHRFRARFYAIYTFGWLAALVACIAAHGILYNSNLRFRWVPVISGAAQPRDWQTWTSDPAAFWVIPLLMTISNPMIILIAIRVLKGGNRFGEA